MIVVDIEAADAKARPTAIEINFDGIMVQFDHPENVVRVYVHVVVVDLLREVGRSSGTGKQVKSNKSERTFVNATVGTNELALRKSHVRAVGEGRGDACGSIRTGSAAQDVCEANETVEVGDL